MKNKKVLLSFCCIFFVTIIGAQESDSSLFFVKKHSFVQTQLQVDSMFMENLRLVLFDKEKRKRDSLELEESNGILDHFFIRFEKTDSLNYYIDIWSSYYPSDRPENIGFCEYKGYLYWIKGEIPPNIKLKKTSKKRRISYIEELSFYDPYIWLLIYNEQTGSIKIKEKNFEKY